jgi:3-oxoacyl-[acyl-carrier-protein] synthase-3
VTAKRVHLTLPTYVLGEQRCQLADAADVLPGVRESLGQAGVDAYWTTKLSSAELALEAGRALLAADSADPEAIDAVIYATNHWDHEIPDNLTVSRTLSGLGLRDPAILGVSLGQCANSQLALQQAAALIESGRAANVLILCVDKIPEGASRLVAPKISMISDCASAVLVTTSRQGAEYLLLDSFLRVNVDLGLVDPEVRFSEYLSGVGEGFVGAVAEAMRRTQLSVPELRAILPNNYNRWIARAVTSLAGFTAEQLYLDNVPRMAHAGASDTFVNLRDYTLEQAPQAGESLLLLATAPNMWGVAILRRVT